jgi:hypothetical protein
MQTNMAGRHKKATIGAQDGDGRKTKTHTRTDTMTFEQCCLAVLEDPKTDSYAKGYANAGLRLKPEFIPTQALYILVNLNHWRGAVAKEVKASLKDISHEGDES